MDKHEYKIRSEEIKKLISEGEFTEAVKIADTIDWNRVKSVRMLCMISDLYKINRRFQESRDILLLAYERQPEGRTIVYSLCELSIKMGETIQAFEYSKKFAQLAPNDTRKYILKYKMYEAEDVSLEERIAVLEELKKRDYREKWGYELAYLYHRMGLETKCVEECDEIFCWFGEGRYVLKALELKLLHQPLTDGQQKKYLQMKQENSFGEIQDEPMEDSSLMEEAHGETSESNEPEVQNFQSMNLHVVQAGLEERLDEIVDIEDIPVEEVFQGEYPQEPVYDQTPGNIRFSESYGHEQNSSYHTSFYVQSSMQDPQFYENRYSDSQEQPVSFGGSGTAMVPEVIPLQPVYGTEYAPQEAEVPPYPVQEQPVSFGESGTAMAPEVIPLQPVYGAEYAPQEAEVLPYPVQDTNHAGWEEPESVDHSSAAIPVQKQHQTEGDTENIVREAQSTPIPFVPKQPSVPEADRQEVDKAEEQRMEVPVLEHTEDCSVETDTSQESEFRKSEDLKTENLKSEYQEPETEESDLMLQQTKEIRLPEGQSLLQLLESQNQISQKQTAAAVGPVPKKSAQISGFEEMLSQGSDGQIRMVISEKSQIEKQITGQMNIADTLAEWEKFRKETSEKRMQDITRRVEKHTGNMFAEFEAAVNSGLLAELEEKAAEEKLQKAAEQQPETVIEKQEEPEPAKEEEFINFEDVKIEDLEELINDFKKCMESSEAGQLQTEASIEITESVQTKESEGLHSTNAIGEQEVPDHINVSEISQGSDSKHAAESSPVSDSVYAAEGFLESGSAYAVEEDAGSESDRVSDQEKRPETPEEGISVQEQCAEPEQKAQEQMSGISETGGGSRKLPIGRTFTEEEELLFGNLLENRRMRMQILHALENIGMASYTGNVVITGEETENATELAANLVRILQKTDKNFTGRTARIVGNVFNKNDVESVLDQLSEGALIVQNIGSLTQEAADHLSQVLMQEDRGLFLVIIDEKEEIDALFQDCPDLEKSFESRIDLKVREMSDDDLVDYAREYAMKKEYSIDDMGVLALYDRIGNMQTIDHKVTVAEVEEMVDDAIYFAGKKNLKHFFDILLGKRYDKEDMIILKEKDFTHY